RDLLGRLFNLVIRVLGVRGIRDTQCGFKLFEGDAARILFASKVIQRWTFDVEVLLVAQEAGLEVREIPVAWRNDPASRVQVLRDSLGTLRDLLRIRLRWLFRPAPKVRTSQGVRRSMT
ncbi:MAG: glycosyltransferase family 2 protein, partial [Planctomycetes bacterium]|nr:glycosyltransferase family 2 protein [Planctomycetota bacterium]